MEHDTKLAFHNSLDIPDEQLEKYIPQLLEGLWSLGSMPDYIVSLIDKNITTKINKITDLGCGKGAVLITLAKKYDFHGLGIDLVPEFINCAKAYAKQFGVDSQLQFRTEDLTQSVKELAAQDMVIYGYDAETLGSLRATINKLAVCVKDDGYVIIESVYTKQPFPNSGYITEHEMRSQIDQSDCMLIDSVDWDQSEIRKANERNCKLIQQNVETLSQGYPNKASLFITYLQNQLNECDHLEKNVLCTTLLLEKRMVINT